MKTGVKISALLLTLSLASPLSANDDDNKGSTLYRALGYGVYASQFGDFAATEHVLSTRPNTQELNPLMQSRGARAATVVAVPFAINWGTEQVRKAGKPKLALWIRIAAIAANGYLVAHHLR